MRARSSALASAALIIFATASASSAADSANPMPQRPSPGEGAPDRYLIGNLLVTRPVIRNTGMDAAPAILAFVDIENRGKAADRLVGASVEGAEQTVIANTAAVPEAAGRAPVALAPDSEVQMAAPGPHLVVQGFRQPLKAGAIIGGQLMFERAGPLTIEFVVETAPVAAKP